jgi:hypothetical protein
MNTRKDGIINDGGKQAMPVKIDLPTRCPYCGIHRANEEMLLHLWKEHGPLRTAATLNRAVADVLPDILREKFGGKRNAS